MWLKMNPECLVFIISILAYCHYLFWLTHNTFFFPPKFSLAHVFDCAVACELSNPHAFIFMGLVTSEQYYLVT